MKDKTKELEEKDNALLAIATGNVVGGSDKDNIYMMRLIARTALEEWNDIKFNKNGSIKKASK